MYTNWPRTNRDNKGKNMKKIIGFLSVFLVAQSAFAEGYQSTVSRQLTCEAAGKLAMSSFNRNEQGLPMDETKYDTKSNRGFIMHMSRSEGYYASTAYDAYMRSWAYCMDVLSSQQ